MGNSSQATGAAKLADRIQRVRRFNRFYTKQIGVLRKRLLHSPFSLTEVRIMYELASGGCKTAADLINRLELDAGYLSRILRGFRGKGLVQRSRSNHDGRQNLLRLTLKGRKEFAKLNTRQNGEVQAMLRHLSGDEQDRLVQSMEDIRRLLQGRPRT